MRSGLIPVRDRDAPADLTLADAQAAQETRVVAEEAPRGKETLLVVEVAPDVRTAVREMLERYGYTVLAVASGTVALRVAVIHPASIHLLLTDVVMPSMRGRRLAEQFTTIRPESKVLYMSGDTDNVVLRHGVLGRGAVYIQKPFAPDTLARKVREALDAARTE